MLHCQEDQNASFCKYVNNVSDALLGGNLYPDLDVRFESFLEGNKHF